MGTDLHHYACDRDTNRRLLSARIPAIRRRASPDHLQSLTLEYLGEQRHFRFGSVQSQPLHFPHFQLESGGLSWYWMGG